MVLKRVRALIGQSVKGYIFIRYFSRYTSYLKFTGEAFVISVPYLNFDEYRDALYVALSH